MNISRAININNAWWPSAKITLIYIVVAAVWFSASDQLLAYLIQDAETLIQFQTLKGWVFVIVTAALLFWLIRIQLVSEYETKLYNRTLFEESPIGLALTRMNGEIVDANRAFAHIIGRSIDEVLQLTYWDITPKEYEADEQQQLQDLENSGRYGLYVKEYFHKDGHRVPVRLQGLIVKMHGEPLIWSSVEDISEHKKLEQKEISRHIQVSNFNKTLAELIKHPYLIKGDLNGMLTTLTKVLSDVCGVARVSVWSLNKTNTSAYLECLDLWETSEQSHSRGAVLSASDYPLYFETLLNDRTLTFNDVYADPRTKEFTRDYFPTNKISSMLDAPFHFAGEIAGVLCLEHTGKPRKWKVEEEAFIISAADILSIVFESSQRKELESSLQRSEKMEALGKLTGGIAHDYNNMLGVVMGYCELLEAALSEQPKLARYAHQIHHASERGAKLTQKLLSFSLKKNANDETVNLNALLQGMQHMLEKTLTARIQLHFDLADDLWTVWLDSGDLEDAIVNLSINAMHAMDGNGQLTLQTCNEQLNTRDAERLDLAPGDYVLLSIIDTGCGIDETTKEKIFEPFYSTKGERGTGLGLSQVYGFVERSNGRIKVDSQQGHGSCFTLYFPRNTESERGEQSAEKNTTADTKGSETILLVDDEATLLDLTREILSTHGYNVICAEGGKQALDILATEAIDIVLSDVIMPEMDGYQLASIIKEKYPAIKIQLASGFTGERNVNLVDDGLQKSILPKPYNAEDLLQSIRKLSNKSNSLLPDYSM